MSSSPGATSPSLASNRTRSGSRTGSVSAPGPNAPSSTPSAPSPTASHSTFIPSSFIKHATLVNNCYPSRPEEKGPKASELSYLVFYTTSKPAKLTKVGNFIERRVVRDYRKKKFSDVHCSLEIIKALLLESKSHLNIFSKNIVSILDALLVDTSNLDIVRHCQNVFSCFCGAHDGSTLGVDSEFRTIYYRVVDRFAKLSAHNGENSHRYRMIGLRALEAVVSSRALYASDFKAQLNLVLPAILDRLIDSKNGVNIALDDSPNTTSLRRSVSIHIAVHPDNIVTDEDVTAEALRCLRALLKNPNGGDVKLALGPTFSYLDGHSRWWPSSFNVEIIKAIVRSILPQYRYMAVNEIISRIDDVDSTTTDAILRLQKKATLISASEAILVSSVSLIGMPVLEVLHSLLVFLIKSLSASASMNKNNQSSQMHSLEVVIQEGLIKSIGGLATHIYYSNQVPHIISHIAKKLSFKLGTAPQPETIEGVPTVEYRAALLKSLQAVIRTSKESGRQGANFHATEISSELLTPCLGLLLDGHVEIRTAFAQVLVSFLATEDENIADGMGLSPMISIPSTSGDLYFRAAAHQTLYAYASSSTLTPKDLVAIYGILKAMLNHFQDDEFIRVVPMLFSLQDWCLNQPLEEQQDDAIEVARKRAVAALIVSYFQMAVSIYDMTEPQEYLQNIKKSREDELQWVPINYGAMEESLARTSELTWDEASEPLSPVLSHPLAREHLVTLLTTVSDRFSAGADRFNQVFNPEAQSGLLGSGDSREFGSGLFLSTGTINGVSSILGHKLERSMDSRIRVSRHLEDWALPKLAPQSMNSSMDLSTTHSEDTSRSTVSGEGGMLSLDDPSMPSKKIGVDNLKAALAAAQMAVDSSSDTGSSSPGSVTRSPSSATTTLQRFYPLSIHSQTLRKHGASPSSGSTASTLASRPDLADLLNTIQVEGPRKNNTQMSLVVPPYV
ncbi:plasma membrane localization protein [Lobosporangium transversale]|uniref:Protein EFR3 n=1 Tax=Lobosporangium transversale TaxID=64571 RepID=A0A1Y2GX59_9FUNG|nr:hypothetical protein BCR41DRAFT_420085 [Lobosporangium transversale]KAF9905629.1 plasma membrane localization protein [Lobosporangium transversale]ORZ24827.1 hypothetical protein BCR41DRAFT_420085 [Lobosporangium transversale]|eukprot:XP_021883808.1 hypothetical protein BCR41DRAFT_420085 [Lobosporangium transversale]